MISAVVLAKNEEDSIKKTLNSLSFCQERIVIDDYSTDKTEEIARQNGAMVYKRKLNGDFAAQRNFGMQKAIGEWVLFVDADEITTPELAGEIKITLRDPHHDVYYIKRRDVWWGREVTRGELWTSSHRGFIRLVQKKSGHWEGRVHERFKTGAPAGVFSHHLQHFPHTGVAGFLEKVDRYSSLRAQELDKKGKRTNVLQIIINPLGKLLYTYFVKLGFLDGVAGFIYSFMMSFHSFLVYSKLYLRQHS